MITAKEMKKKRFQFLYRLYELTKGAEFVFISGGEISQELGFQDDLTQKIIQYLVGEELIKCFLGGNIGITHLGIREVEEALSNPDKPTDHFSPFNTINIISAEQIVNPQIQQAGSGAT